MITFHCQSCNHNIHFKTKHAGKRGKCPKCGQLVAIPEIQKSQSVAEQSNCDDVISLIDANLNRMTDKDSKPDISREDMFEYQRNLYADESEPVAKRKQPWLIDIFLYPTSISGLTVLGMVIGVPFLTHLLVKFFGLMAMVFPPAIILFAILIALRVIINIVFMFYMYWYLCECIRDSAQGGIRAPETMAITPGAGELIFQFLKIVLGVAFFSAPAVAYYSHAQQYDAIFWALCAYGVFFLPIGLLAVIMFDSFSALNPILLIRSIFINFWAYCGVVLLFYILGALIWLMSSAISGSLTLSYITAGMGIYLFMITAHLLGRFYWRYRKKLDWPI